MKLVDEFRAFALKGNVVDLAVAVVIGGAFGKIVAAFVDDLVMPVLGGLLPSGDWQKWTVTPLHIKLGHLLGTLLDFTVIALVMFIVVVKFMGAVLKKKEAAPTTRKCVECLEEIPLAARKCRACASPQS